MDEEEDKLRPPKKRKFKTLELLERLKEAGAVGEISRNEIAPGSGSGSDSGSSPVRQKGPPKNPKRKTTGEVELLEKTYAMETYPSRASRAELSEKLGLSDQQLHRWFYRRRLKDMKVGNKAGLSGGGGGVGLGDEVEGVVGEVASGSGSGSSPFGGGHVDLQMQKRYYEPPQAISELRAAIAALVEAQLGDSLMENGPIVGMEFDPLPPRGFGPHIGGGIFDYDPLPPGRSTSDAGSDPLQSRGAFGAPIGGISDFTNMGSKKKCSHCEATKTPQWKTGPMGPRTLCNACGLRYKSGRLVPEYRPSTYFVPCVHSNYHIGGLSGLGPSLSGASGKPNIGISESDHLSLEAFGAQIDGISDHSPLPIGAIGEPINGIFDSDPLSPGAIGELFDYDPLSLRASGMPIVGISDSNPLPPGALGEPNSGIPDSDRFSPEQLAGPLMLSDSDSLSPGAFSVPIAFNMPTKKRCSHCQVTKTPQWREGPMGPKTLCNACGVRYRSGRLLPGYRPAASPTFVPDLHSNSHKKVLQMRNKFGQE